MDFRTAEQLATLIGGEAWKSGDRQVVTVHRDDGAVIVFSEDEVHECDSQDSFDLGHILKSIRLEIPDIDDLFVIVDLQGTVFYRDNAMERGWRHRKEAETEAQALESRGEGKFRVVLRGELGSSSCQGSPR